MSKETKNTIRLGMFVTFSFLLFITGAYYIGTKQNMFKPKFLVSAYFNNVNGLRKGHNIRYAGITVRNMSDVVIVNDSTLRVDMLLEEKVRNFIKKDAVASITSDGLVAGSMIVNIIPGDGDAAPVEDNDILASYTRTDPNDMLKTLGNTNENIALLSLHLLEITEKLNHGYGTLPLLIRDSLMAEDLRHSLHNLQATTVYAAKLSQQLHQSLAALSSTEGTLGQLLHDSTLVTQMENFAFNLDTLFIRQTEPLIENLNKSGEDIAKTSAQLKTILDKIDQSEGLANTILKDTVAAADFREVMRNLHEGTDRFNENMEALKHNFLFRRYFKKQEKEQEKARKATEKAAGKDQSSS